MCVIVYVPMDIELPDYDTVVKCMTTNPDGAGFAVGRDNGSQEIYKGYWQTDEIYDDLQIVREEDPLCTILIHFRLATHGTISIDNCHPFTCGTDSIIMHNGIIPFRTLHLIDPTLHYGAKQNLSDTHQLAVIMSSVDHAAKCKVLQWLTGATVSKFAMLYNGKVELFGSFIKQNGISYSNLHWQTPLRVSRMWRFMDNTGDYAYGDLWDSEDGEDGNCAHPEEYWSYSRDGYVMCQVCGELLEDEDELMPWEDDGKMTQL